MSQAGQRIKLFGLRVLKLRQQLGLTQQDLAFKAGLAVTHISRVEHGYHVPNIETAYKLAEALEVAPTVLIDGNPDLDAGLEADETPSAV
jgi:transcriptional regulator with XRE-family HTH domain